MWMWLVSLAVTLALTGASTVPGGLGQRLGKELTRAAREQTRLPLTVQAELHGDPVFELPWGYVPELTLHVHGFAPRGIPFEDVRIELSPVHVSPWVVLSHARPRLLEPARAHIAVRVGRKEVQAAVNQMLDAAPRFEASVPLIGKISPHVEHVDVKMGSNAILLDGTLTLKPGAAPRSFSASLGFAVENGKRLVPGELHVKLGSLSIPSAFLGAARHVNLIDTADLPLPPGQWKMELPAIDAEGFELRVSGQVNELGELPTP